MIKSIRITNFFGFLESCTIDFEEGENVLVGINGSGKSNLLKALKLLKEGIGGIGYEEQINLWGGVSDIQHRGFQSDNPNRISITISIKAESIFTGDQSSAPADGGFMTYEMNIVEDFEPSFENFYLEESLYYIYTESQKKASLVTTEDGGGVFYKIPTIISDEDNNSISDKDNKVHYPGLHPRNSIFQAISDPIAYPFQFAFVQAMSKILVYDHFDVSEKSRLRERSIFNPAKFLKSNGDNLNSVLQYLKETNQSVFSQIQESLKSINENYEEIPDLKDDDGKLTLRLAETKLHSPISNLQISDGTLRFLCLMTILYNPNRGPLICIDEPELGLHPDMLLNLRRAIEFASQTSQVIIATHSPLLLNLFEIENILVFEKSITNGTLVNKFKTSQFDRWKEDFLPGDLWLNGHLGGTRW
ncbi:MAG: AAA family ATPase [Flavobacteriales bacterium]|nr:AAA family ATPase [Flavobacteriales bacterium]